MLNTGIYAKIKSMHEAIETRLLYSAKARKQPKSLLITDDEQYRNARRPDIYFMQTKDRGIGSLIIEILDAITLNGQADIKVELRNSNYSQNKENAWEYYFEPIKNKEKINYRLSFSHRPFKDPFVAEKKEKLLPLSHALRNRVVFKKEILDAAAEFKKKIAGKVIGVHCRGFDILRSMEVYRGKFAKAPVERYFEEIEKAPYDKIFLATDDANIFKLFEQRYGEKLLSVPQKRTDTKEDRLMDKYPESQKEIGEKSLISNILLSQTDFFLHGLSNVPVLAKCLNPNLRTKDLDYCEANKK